jgi:hypothetical protein
MYKGVACFKVGGNMRETPQKSKKKKTLIRLGRDILPVDGKG